MNPDVFYDAAKKLSNQLKMLDIIIRSHTNMGEHGKADAAQVKRQHVESKLRQLNHHIITQGA